MRGLAGLPFAAQREVGEIRNESDKRVEALGRTFSDAGSIPAASTMKGRVPFIKKGTLPFIAKTAVIGVGCRALRAFIDETARSATLRAPATAIPAAPH